MKRLYTLLFALCFGVAFINAQIIMSADFEGSLNSDWTIDNADSWMHGDAASLSSQFLPFPEHTQFMAANDDGAGQMGDASGRLISPVFDLTTATNPILTFDAWFRNADYQGGDETAKVFISFDGGTTWAELYNIDDGANLEWHSHNVSLSSYVGVAGIQLAFEYQDGGTWNYGMGIDNVVVSQPLDWDVAVTRFELNKYNEGPTTTAIEGEITNLGVNTVTSFDVTWTNGTDTYTESVTGVSIEPFATYNFTHADAATVAVASLQNIEVTVSNLDGNVDMNTANNMASDEVIGLAFVPARKVVVEEATGTWCPWCVRGAVGMDEMAANFSDDFIGIAVHNGDPMVVDEYDSNLDVGGYPSSWVDRAYETDPNTGDLTTALNDRLSVITPVAVSMDGSFDSGTREVSITVSAELAAPLNGDFRFNLIVTEDGVTGTGSGYDQANAYVGGGNGPMGGYELLPNPVPAAEMVYNHVARAILGDWEGTASSIPAVTDFNEVHSYTYTYEVPMDYDMENIHLVGMVIDQETGGILNGAQISLTDLLDTSNEDLNYNENLAKVFPNPFSDVTNISLNLNETSEVSVQVYNTVGQLVSEKFYGELVGEQILPFNAANISEGTYFLHIRINDQIVTKRVTLVK